MTITTVLCVGFVSACGIRLETSVPSELTPDSNEIARQAIVNDFELVLLNADSALAANTASDEVTSELESVAGNAETRSTALAGIYESGLPPLDTELTDTDSLPTIQLADEGTAETTANKLLESAARARSSLEIPEDPELARVIASAAIGQVIESLSLAKVASVESVWPEALQPVPWTTEAPVLSDETFIALIQSQDYAGYAYEVAAAMGKADKRDGLLKLAKAHRQEAERLAVTAAVAGTTKDPRRSAYSLSLSLDSENHVASAKEIRKLLRDIELSLAQQYLDVLPQVSKLDRALLFDAALSAAQAAHSRGADLAQPFPLVTDSDQIQPVAPVQ